MQREYEARKKYGGVYYSHFPNGLLIPWKLLSVEDWIRYNRDYNRGVIPDCNLEDEIFRKCVLDDSIVRQMDYLPAGIVGIVTTNIWRLSGPINNERLNADMHSARVIVSSERTSVFHDFMKYITMAFPYTPEQVYAMDYETFMIRFAQAERKLLALGVITEPISVNVPEEEQEPPAPRQKKPRERLDAKKLYDEQQQQRQTGVQPEQVKPSGDKSGKWWNTSPVLEATKRQKIDFAAEKKAADRTVLDSHGLREPPEMQEYLIEKEIGASRDKMVKDAQWIYKDLIEQLERQRKK